MVIHRILAALVYFFKTVFISSGLEAGEEDTYHDGDVAEDEEQEADGWSGWVELGHGDSGKGSDTSLRLGKHQA